MAIVVNNTDFEIAKTNRITIETGLLSGGTINLPTGEISLDQAISLGPQHSGCTFNGTVGTVLRNIYFTGNGLNETLVINGLGVSYVAYGQLTGDKTVQLDSNLAGTGLPWNDPGAQTQFIKAGNTLYGFIYDSYFTQNPPPRKRYTIQAFDSATRTITTVTALDPNLLAFKWMDGTAIANVKEGSRTVKISNLSKVTGFMPGQYVYVTDGPSIANNSNGEYKRILGIDTNTGVVLLDTTVTRAYTVATLVRSNPVANVTISNLTLAQPVNPQALPCQISIAVDCIFNNVTCHTPNDPALTTTGLNSCGRMLFANCTINGGLGLNSCHDITVAGGLYATIAGEEGSTNCQIINAIIRVNSKQAGMGINGVTWTTGADRLKIINTRIEGFGIPIAAGGAMCPIMASGRDLNLTNVIIGPSALEYGVGGSWLNSDNGSITGGTADLPMCFSGGNKWVVSKSSAQYWGLFGGSGIIAGCVPAPNPASGWVIS